MDVVTMLNSQAAMLIDKRMYGPSIKLLRKALAFMMDDNVPTPSDDECIGPFFNTSMTSAESSTQEKAALNQQTRITNPEVVGGCFHLICEAECSDDEDFVYRTPLRNYLTSMTSTQDIEKDETESEDDLMSYILLFNIALAYHLWALEEGRAQPNVRRLKKAIQFYELSFSIQVDVGHLSMTQILALVNNCASIYRQLNRRQRAEKFYRHMLSTLMTMVEVGATSEVEQLNGFLHNACRLILQDVAAPAA
jgi:hypothetical protein